MQVVRNLTTKWQIPYSEWGLVFVIAALMTNLGYGSNLLLALQCEQYYFEYLLFFTLVYGGKTISDRFAVARDLSSVVKTAARAGLLISVTFFGILWAYNTITNCLFEPIAFLTSRFPLILLLSGVYQYWRFNQPDSKAKTAYISLRAINNGLLRLDKDEIVSASLQGGSLKVSMVNGDSHRIDISLKTLQDELDNNEQFYRLNRTTLVRRDQVISFVANNKHQLCVTLRTGEAAMVNKNKVRAFKNWLD
ncbi:MAG: LytTR family transcriptional regulator [Roseivirga sp.]|nr:LytTR family transcriptional regulator [Roseivirga sp.]